MEQVNYIHGTHDEEQERLSRLNRLTNPPFLRFLEVEETSHVLEVGSGLGILAAEVARRVPGGEVVGAEYSPDQLAKTPQDIPNLRFIRGDAHHLPFEDDRFDVVYCRYVLEHVQDPSQVLREMRRVLKPGGKAFAQENDWNMVAFDPDCPTVDALKPRFVELQARFGGDALIGKRLFSLLHHAGFRDIALSYQPEIHVAHTPSFHLWVENMIEIFTGAAPALQTHRLATAGEIDRAITELRDLLERNDASALFHWNRAIGIK